MIKKLLMLAVTSGLAAKALQRWMDRESARQDRHRADLQRWEDEGGNLPKLPPGSGGPARMTSSRRAQAADGASPRTRTRRNPKSAASA